MTDPQQQTTNPNARLLRLATIASVSTATLLLIAKLIAWLITGSVSVLASLTDSLMDIAASLINLFAVRYSLRPADEEHRFGHGKVEPLAGLAQAMFIGGSALFLVLYAVDRIIHPKPVDEIAVGLVVMTISMIATLALLAFQYYVIRRTQSTVIRADALHYATDVLTNFGIIVALVLTAFGMGAADAWIAILIAIYIFYSAGKIGYDAFHLLIDRELPDDIKARILEVPENHPGVLGYHDLRTRQSGQTAFIQLHLELDSKLTFVAAHDIADEVEKEIQALIPGSEVIVHHDPVVVD